MTAVSAFGLPTESLYTELRDLPHLMKIAWLDALANPSGAERVVEDAVGTARRIAKVTELHLRGAVERATRRENAADRATEAAERRITTALAGIVVDGADHLDPHGCYVYLLWGADDSCPIYVGKSTNIYARLGAHMNDHEKRAKTQRIQIIRCRTSHQMDQTEWRLIRHYQPPLNTIGVGP